MSKEELSGVCFDCGVKYLTKEQKDNSGVCTFWEGRCVVCKEVKGVTSERHYNYLQNPTP